MEFQLKPYIILKSKSRMKFQLKTYYEIKAH